MDALPEELAELYRSLEATLLDEICSRLKLAGELNEVTVQDIRALRSHGISLEEIERTIAERDERDMNREIAPLKQADDAVLVDTSDMGIEEVTSHIISLYEEKKAAAE